METQKILHFKFNETDGVFRDYSNSQLYGTINEKYGKVVEGKIGRALMCFGDGIGQMPATSTTNSTLNELGGEITQYSIALWIHRLTTQTVLSRIVEKSGSRYPFVIRQDSTNTPLIALYDGTNNPTKFGPVLDIGKWYHLVFIVDRENWEIRLFVNGEEYESPEEDTTRGNSINNTSIFSWGNTTGFLNRAWKGIVDDFRIYTGILSKSEIDFIYNEGKGREGEDKQGRGTPFGGILMQRRRRNMHL